MSEFTYNPKLDYLICRTVAGRPANYAEEEGLRQVFFGLKARNSQLEERIYCVKHAFNALKQNSYSAAYQYYTDFFSNITPSQDVLIEQFFRNSEPTAEAFHNFMQTMGELYDFIMLIHNARRIVSQKIPIVFQPQELNKLANASKDEFSETSYFAKLYRFCELKSVDYNRRFDHVLSSAAITQTINLAANKTILMDLGISHVLLYGSYVKGTETTYSDIDLNLFSAAALSRDTKLKILKLLAALFNKKADVTFSLDQTLNDFKTEVGSDNYLEIF
jgi:predicted nucleotidyltransferase